MSKLFSLKIDHPEAFRPTFLGVFYRAFKVCGTCCREILLCIVLLASGLWTLQAGSKWFRDELGLFFVDQIELGRLTLGWIWMVWVSLFFSMVVFRALRAVEPTMTRNHWVHGLKMLPWVALQTFLVAIVVAFGLLLLIIPGILVFVACSLATYVLLFERSDGMLGISRSLDITRHHRWMIFFVVLVTFVGEWILDSFFEILLVTTGWRSIYTVVAGTGDGVSLMVTTLVMTVIYHDIRLARQDFEDLGPEFYSEYFPGSPLGSEPIQEPLTSNI